MTSPEQEPTSITDRWDDDAGVEVTSAPEQPPAGAPLEE